MHTYTIKQIIDNRISIKPCTKEQFEKIREAYEKETGHTLDTLFTEGWYYRLYPEDYGLSLPGKSSGTYLKEGVMLANHSTLEIDFEQIDLIKAPEIPVFKEEDKKLKFKEVIPIFGMNFSYSEGLSQEEYDDFTENCYELPLKPIECYGAYVDSHLSHFSLRFIEEFSIPVLAHEIFHVVNRLGEYLNISCEETKARLIEYLIKLVLDKKGI